MTAYYSGGITIGPYLWTFQSTDPTDPDVDNVLGGLEFGWSMADADLMPCQPDPMDAAFAVLVHDIDDYPEAKVGASVSIIIQVDPVGGGPIVFAFYGRVTDIEAVPARRGGMYLSALALDYTVDERPIGVTSVWPAEAVPVRLARAFAEANVPMPDLFGLENPLPPLPARDVALTTIPAYMAEVLPYWILDDLFILAPLIDGHLLDGSQNFALDALGHLWDAPPPGEFGLTDGGDYGPTFDPDSVNMVLGGAYVRRGARWVQRKAGRPDQIVYTDPDGLVRVYGAAAGEATVTTAVSGPFSLGSYIPELDWYLEPTGNLWEVDRFTYELSSDIEAENFDPAALTAGWLPDHAAPEGDAARTLCYRRPIIVTDIPEAQNPGSGSFYFGQLRSARFCIERNRMRIDFTVRRTLPQTSSSDVLTPAGLAASAFSAVTVAQLDPDFTVYDYRLVKEA